MPRESGVYAKWSLEMTRSGLFRPGERVGVAVSGGGDSVLLLDFMTRFALKGGFKLAVVHFNHHLRGAESDADESFVRGLAGARGIEFFGGGADVQSKLRARKIDFRLDSTNLDTRLARNKVRASVLPLLEKEFNPAVVRLLKDLATRARDDEAYLEQQARERARPWRVREGMEEKIPLSPLEDFHPAMERRVLRQMIAAARGSLRGVTYDHVEALRRFVAEAQSGRRLVLPSLMARKEFDWLVIGAQPQAEPDSGFSYPVEAPCAVS